MVLNRRKRVLEQLNRMKGNLEAAETAGNVRDAYGFCFQLFGALDFVESLHLLPEEDILHWNRCVDCYVGDLEDSLFGPNLEEGHTS